VDSVWSIVVFRSAKDRPFAARQATKEGQGQQRRSIAQCPTLRDNSLKSKREISMGQEQPSRRAVPWQRVVWKSAIHGILVFALLAVYHQIVPRFVRSFDDLDLALPTSSVLVANMSNHLVQRSFIAIPQVLFLLAVDVAVLFLLHLIPNVGSILGSLWFAMGLAFLALIVLLTIAGLIMPMNAAVETLATA
jgi:hypothetical protein